MHVKYKYKKQLVFVLRMYKKISYDEYVKKQYPITDLITVYGEELDVEIVLLEETSDSLLLHLVVTWPERKITCCSNFLQALFEVHKTNTSN